jgi:hypothetical protein
MINTVKIENNGIKLIFNYILRITCLIPMGVTQKQVSVTLFTD